MIGDMKIGGAQDKPLANTAGTGARSPSETQGGRAVTSDPGTARPQSVPAGKEGLASRLRGIPDTLSTLIPLLDRGSQRQKALLSLLQLVRELPAGEDGSPVDSGDSRLLRKVLILWRERFGAELDPRGRGRLELLERQLSPGQDEPFYLFAGEAAAEGSRFSLRAKGRRTGGQGDVEEEARLVLDMELPRLERVRSILKGTDTGAECRIDCASGKTRRSLRKSLPELRRRLKAGIPLKNLSLGRLREVREEGNVPGPKARRSDADEGRRGIGLWG